MEVPMIKDLRLIDPSMGIAGGSFKSTIFKNDGTDELSICLRNLSLADYAEKCIGHFNSMPDDMVDEICSSIVKCCEQGGINKDFELPKIKKSKDILEYCWFFELTVDIPQNDEVSYLVEGEGDWGEIIGIVIKNGHPCYVGSNYGEYL